MSKGWPGRAKQELEDEGRGTVAKRAKSWAMPTVKDAKTKWN